MSNMSVSVTLRLQDDFTRPVRNLLQIFQQLTRAAQDFNRATAGSAMSTQLNRLQGQVRGLAGEVRNLANQFSNLGRSITGAGAGQSFAQRQISDMRTLISLQQQAIANNTRLAAAPPGPAVPRLPGLTPPGSPGSIFGRRGFNPNASVVDRMQYRGVNLVEQTLATGVLDFDRVRTQLRILSVPRPDPENPNQMLPPVLTPENLAQAEVLARGYSTVFRVLSPAHILDTFRELATQFEHIQDAFALLPHMLNVQEWHVLMGDNVEQARDGMLRLLRAIGLSGRLINNAGRLSIVDPNDPNSPIQAAEFLDIYLRARMVGGRDVSADQVFQVMKYLKASGQSLDLSALLTTFVGMADLRGNTFGTQLNMLITQLTGTATQAAQRAMVEYGLGTITHPEGSGPHSFQGVDEAMMRANPYAWFGRHVMGPQGMLRRAGLDPNTASMAEIATLVRRITSNRSAENMFMTIIGQWREWQGQTIVGNRINLTPEARDAHARGMLWHGLVSARSQMMNALGTIADAFAFILLPPIQLVASGLQNLAALVSPQTGNRWASTGLVAGGLLGGFWLLRSLARGLGTIPRILLGGGLGLAFGGISEALMGALLLRGMGTAVTSAMTSTAATAAATVAGMTLGRRILAGL